MEYYSRFDIGISYIRYVYSDKLEIVINIINFNEMIGNFIFDLKVKFFIIVLLNGD